MPKLKVGTSQAFMMDDGLYIIEVWNGKTWVKHSRQSFKSKVTADEWGYSNLKNHRR